MTTSRPLNSRKSTRIAQAVAYRFTRHHPALQVGDTLTVQSKREEPVSVFIGQSALDAACGVHCAAMMLILLDLAKSSALLDMHRRKFGISSTVFSAFQKTYFEGVNADEYVPILESLDLPLQMTLRTDKDKGKTGSVDAFAADCLMRGELLAIVIASVNNRRTKHWVLGIGIEGAVCGRDSIPDGLLLLDPSASAPPAFSACNARLRIPKDGRNSTVNKLAEKLYKKVANLKPIHWIYESPDWRSEPVRLMAAVRFRLKT
jgi:hypothetical protein